MCLWCVHTQQLVRVNPWTANNGKRHWVVMCFAIPVNMQGGNAFEHNFATKWTDNAHLYYICSINPLNTEEHSYRELWQGRIQDFKWRGHKRLGSMQAGPWKMHFHAVWALFWSIQVQIGVEINILVDQNLERRAPVAPPAWSRHWSWQRNLMLISQQRGSNLSIWITFC